MDLAIGTDRVRRAAIVVLATLLLAASVLLLLLLEDPPVQGSARVVVPLSDGAGVGSAGIGSAGIGSAGRESARPQDPAPEAVTAERNRLQADIERARKEIETLQADLSQRDERLEENEDRLAEMTLARTNLQTEVTDLIVARQAAEAQLDKALLERDEVSRQLEQAKRERASTQAVLTETKVERQRLIEEVKALKFQVASLTASSGRAAERTSVGSSRPLSSVPGEQEPVSFTDTTADPPVETSTAISDPERAEGEAGALIAGSTGAGPAGVGESLVASLPEPEGAASARPIFRAALFDQAVETMVPGRASGRVAGSRSGEGEDLSLISGALDQGVEQYNNGDYKLAFDIWFPLAEQGVRRAQFYVGSLFHEGRGVGEDPIRAFYWLSLSDQAGYPKAGEVLDHVEAVMSAAEIDAANKLLEAKSN